MAKSKQRTRWILMIVIVVVLALGATGYIMRIDRLGFNEIDFVDCGYINNQLYFNQAFTQTGLARVPVDATTIDKKIGAVRFRLSENVHNSWYINRNGDAAYLEPGTEIYSVKGNPDAIAVKSASSIMGFHASQT
jgi:hypothetical protein